MNKFFNEISKNFGFGCMRLPMSDNEVDVALFSQMVDEFIKAGFNYFDIARGYLSGKCEDAIKKGLTSRYPRSSYILTDKLTTNYFNTEADLRPLFENQLQTCGVDYFDFYLMHAQNAEFYKKYVNAGAYKFGETLRAEGKIKHFGISFHDKAEVLERILTEQPAVEVVQLQFNYVDYDDPGIDARNCYEVCRKFHKPVIVMEPVRGGSLANLPDEAKGIFEGLNGGSQASYAIRFAASFDNVAMVLSGMSSLEELRDNISFMQSFSPLSNEEKAAIDKVCTIFKSQGLIPCTACRYCVDGCPAKINIPDLFACLNSKKQFKNWNSDWYYMVHTMSSEKASACLKCGKCEKACPQHLQIRELLKTVAAEFEK